MITIITLPVAPALLSCRLQQLRQEPQQRSAQKSVSESVMAKILVVDDSPTQLTNLVKIVQGHGHTTVTATNGLEGYEVAKAEKPDLILMDVVMPELNGFQATRKITKDPETSHIPVVLVTTKDQDTDRVWGERQGAAGYLVKPPSEAELIGKINELLG